MLKEKLLVEESEQKYRKLIKTTESVCIEGKFDSGNFWKLQKKLNQSLTKQVPGVCTV